MKHGPQNRLNATQGDMASRADLVEWVFGAIQRAGGQATVVQVARDIWDRHREELEQAGELFYTWQYDMRWATQKLPDAGRLCPAEQAPRGIWMVAKA